MNRFVADPEWGWWIVFYFFLGGIAAGSYFIATLIELFGRPADRGLARIGYRLAFPLIAVCGVLLIVDLNRPERFWHMLLKSEVVREAFDQGWPTSGESWRTMSQAPIWKPWSPMSIGSYALSLFGLCSGLSLLGSLWEGGRLARWLRHGPTGRALAVLGCLVGFFVASYTGTLLTATNQPIWSDTVWIAPLFLTSAASTGLATLILFARWRGPFSAETLERLERADVWALCLEGVVLIIFLASLGDGLREVLATTAGKVLVGGTLVFGLCMPLLLHRMNVTRTDSEPDAPARDCDARPLAPVQAPTAPKTPTARSLAGPSGSESETRHRPRAMAAAAFALVGGFLLRYGIVATPPELLAHGSGFVPAISPEDGRPRGGGPGADPGNRSATFRPASRVFEDSKR